jgi:LPS export ABC transporter protein LptC
MPIGSEKQNMINPVSKLRNSFWMYPQHQHVANSVSLPSLVKRVRITLSFIALFFLAVSWNACENKPGDINPFGPKDIGKEEARSVVINYTIGGKARAMLSSPVMIRVQDTLPYVEFPTAIHVDFFNNDTIRSSLLDAKYAKYYESRSQVYLKDSVRVINIKNGDTLYCDELYWDRNRVNTEFYTDKPVKIRTRTHIINGVGMESKQDFKDWHIRQSTGIIKVPSSEFPG